jgi:predicted Zn-dependent peptidase
MTLRRTLILLALAGVILPGAESVRLPRYSRDVLSNGIVLDVIPNREVPLVNIRVVLRGGVESDPAERGGLSAVVADALRRGTARRTADQFSQEVDSLGAMYNASATMQSTVVNIELLSKDLDKGLDLLLDALLHPTFPEEEMKKLLARRIDGSKALKDSPQAAASEYFRTFYFGPDHPYGRPIDEISQARITREDIAAYHKRMYVGRNMIVLVAGDVDENAGATVRKAFERVGGGSAYQWRQAKLPAQKGPRIAIIDKPDATETQFRIGMAGIDRTDPDRVPLWLVNTLFGGRFTSMLNEALRVNSGLSYGANSSFDQNHLQGRITISSFTATQNTVKAIDLALETLKNVAAKGITGEQLASVKAYVKGTYPPAHLETADQLAEVVGDIELFDLNRGDVDDLFSRIDAVTVEKANEIVRRYLKPENLTFLLFGNASKFPPGVENWGKAIVKVPVTQPGIRVPVE